jgi:hypothetical protein
VHLSPAPILLTLLPPLLTLGVLAARVTVPPKLRSLSSRRSTVGVVCLLVGLIPVSLVLLASGSTGVRLAASVLSSAGALWGARRLGGLVAALVVAAAIVAVWVGVGGVTPFNLAALAAALGGGELAYRLIGSERLLGFFTLLAGVDCLIVTGGLTQGLFAASITDGGNPLALQPPTFSGVVIGGVFLGGIDLACAVMLGFDLVSRSLHRRDLVAVISVFALTQALLVTISGVAEIAVPATLPALVALFLARRLVARRTHI